MLWLEETATGMHVVTHILSLFVLVVCINLQCDLSYHFYSYPRALTDRRTIGTVEYFLGLRDK